MTMEKNLPDDNLEKFLQKAFERFEEDPSPGLWDKIEAELPVAAPVFLWSAFRKVAVGVAASLLLGLLVFQHFSHQKELNRLAEELACTRANLQGLQEQLAHTPCPAPLPTESIAAENVVSSPGTALVQVPAVVATGIPVPPEEEVVVFHISSALDALPLPMKLEWEVNPSLSARVPAPRISLAPEKKQWTMGLNSGIARTFFSEKSQPDPGPGHHEPVRAPGKETVELSQQVMAGIFLNRDLGKRWSVETGLQYRRFSFQYTHQPDLKFGERRTQGNPGPNPRHEFGYYLNAPSGTIYVSLSAGQADPAETISNQEDLQVEITTKERIEVVTIPLLLGYQIGNGRLSGQLKAGLLTNIGLSHAFDVSGISFQNQKFKPHPGGGAQVEPSRLNPVSFDYFLGAGLAFDIAPAWRIGLMPSLSGALTSKTDALFHDPVDFSAGVTASVGYRF